MSKCDNASVINVLRCGVKCLQCPLTAKFALTDS